MKTMKLGDSIKRVGEKDAEGLLKQGWNYCPKKEWKDNVRVLKTKEVKEKKSKKKSN